MTTLAVLGASGGVGTSTIALALARILPRPVALLDLDLAGGVLAARAGAGVGGATGLAGEPDGARALERLARPCTFGSLVPAPSRPDLAWLVADGLVEQLCSEARASHRSVVADLGRGGGPALEALYGADATIVVGSADERAIESARRLLDFLHRLGERRRIAFVLGRVRRRDALAPALVARALGRPVDAWLPDDPRILATTVPEAVATVLLRLVERLVPVAALARPDTGGEG